MRPDEGEGGELYSLLVKLETDVRPLLEVFVPQFAVEELFAILAGFKPDIIGGFEQIKASAEGLIPPAEFQQDHQRLLVYLEEQLEAARSIPDEPTNTTFVGRGPPPGVPGAPPECVAGEFSEDFLRLVAVHFGVPRADCPPPGPPSGPPP
jgi:hypothetical protein